MTYPDLTGADLATRLLSLPLVACRALAAVPPHRIADMPDCTVEVPTLQLLVAATQHQPPMFVHTLEQVSRRHAADILLIRGGRHPELIDPVTVDVALRYDRDAILITQMLFFRHTDKGLWLVPAVRGPFIELTSNGLRLEMLPPFIDPDDRSAGLCRAATEIARLARRQAGTPQ